MKIELFNVNNVTGCNLKEYKYFLKKPENSNALVGEDVVFPSTTFHTASETVTDEKAYDASSVIKDTLANVTDNDVKVFFMVLTVLAGKSTEHTNELLSFIVENIDRKLTKEINGYLGRCSRYNILIDSFLEDWEALYDDMVNRTSDYSVIVANLNTIVKKYFTVLSDPDKNIYIKTLPGSSVYSVTVRLEEHVIFGIPFLYSGYDTPGQLLIGYEDPRFDRLANIVNTTKLVQFKLYINNEFRESGCIDVYFNQYINKFIVLV